jgi:pyruvate kinase
MNLPGVIVDLPTLTAKDEKDLVEFGVKQNVDFIAASFVRKASDLDYIRKVLGEDGKHIKIISKIENQEGLQNYDAILESSDGIMVARGDLGMEIPPQKVFLAQKWMIEKANLAAKPVVTATQMLESMIKAPRPTRAEAGDVANAVLDGTDCVMLSGESANGDYPINAVTIMAKISVEAEQNYNNARHQREMNEMTKSCSLTESMCQSVVHMAETQNADAIICCTDTGLVPRLVAKYRPSADILALSASETVVRQFKQQRGVKGLLCQPTKTNLEIIKFAIQ